MAEKKSVIAGFKEFILRGNVVDLAIAVVIGAAFGAVVTAVVKDFLTPLIGAIFGSRGAFSGEYFTLHHSQFGYGDFLNALISFLAVASAIYFLVVLPLNTIAERRARGVTEPESDLRPCPECLTEIPKAANRCAACTAEVGAVS
jgi:large conductance mechanosensitive channel